MPTCFKNLKFTGQQYPKIVSVLLAMVGLLTGCGSLVQDVDPARLPNAEAQLVVHCYISPQDTLLVAAVTASRTAVGKQITTTNSGAVQNATVTLSEGGRSITLSYNTVLGIYQANAKQFPIMTGQTYQLNASTPDGKQVTATTTIPALVPISTIEVDSVAAQYGSGKDYFARFSWQDPAQVINYYHVAGDIDYQSITRVYSNATTYKEILFNNIEPIYFNNGGSNSPYITDETYNGRAMSSPKARLFGVRSNTSTNVNVYLLNVTEAYYRYHESVRQQQGNDENPFAEPTLIQGNIQGGFGCFGGYDRTMKTLRIR